MRMPVGRGAFVGLCENYVIAFLADHRTDASVLARGEQVEVRHLLFGQKFGVGVEVAGHAFGGILLIYGVVTIVSFFLRDSRQGSFVFELFLGIVAAALGLLFLLRPVIVASVLPVILGLFIVVDGLVKLKRALELRRMLYLRWTVPLALSAGSAVLGLVIVFQPFLAAEALVMLIGAVLIYEGLSDLWTIFRVSQWTKEYRKHHPVDVDPIDFE